MQIEVKGIKFHRGHDDGHSYTGVVFIDGVKAFEASNDGWGGPDLFTPIKGYNGPDEREINDWLKSNTPQIKYFGQLLDNSLDLVVGDELNKAAEAHELKRLTAEFARLQKRKVVAMKDGQIFVWKFDPTPANCAEVKRRHPEYTIVNGNDDLQDNAIRAYDPMFFERKAMRDAA